MRYAPFFMAPIGRPLGQLGYSRRADKQIGSPPGLAFKTPPPVRDGGLACPPGEVGSLGGSHLFVSCAFPNPHPGHYR